MSQSGNDAGMTHHSITPILQGQQRRWAPGGDRPTIEDLIVDARWSGDDSDLLYDLIVNEFNIRRELGELPDPGEYVERYGGRFPDLPDDLEALGRQPATTGWHPGGAGSAETPTEFDGMARFIVEGSIASGGMGQVLSAQDAFLGRRVAIKWVRPDRTNAPSVFDRFLHEARISAQLDHPNIMPVYFGRDAEGGRPFFTMRLCDNVRTLREAILSFHTSAGGDQQFRSLLGDLIAVAKAVAFAHSKGVIHRDLKPDNILIGDYGQVYVSDWGLARRLGTADHGGPGGDDDGLGTQVGQVLGTPGYMAPEQAMGESADARSDIFALGVCFHELLAGRSPFPPRNEAEQESLRDYLNRAYGEPPPPPSRVTRSPVPKALAAICLKAMAWRPGDRYQSAGEFAADLEHWLADEPITARRDGWPTRLLRWARRNRSLATGLGVLFVMALIGAGVGFAWKSEHAAEMERQRDAADDARDAAERSRLAQQRTAYAADMTLACRSWEDGQVAQVYDLLRNHLDEPGVRGWEWYHLAGLCRAERHLLAGHDGPIATAAFGPSGDLLATGGADRVVRLWDTRAGKLLVECRGHRGRINQIAFHPDGDSLASCDADGVVRSWRASTGEPIRSSIAHTLGVSGLSFSPDGSQLATAGMDGSLRLWDAADGELVRTFPVQERGYLCVAHSPDGKLLAASREDGLLQVWQVGDGRLLGSRQVAPKGTGRLCFSPDSTTLAVSDSREDVLIVRTDDLEEVRRLTGHRLRVLDLAFSPDGGRLITGSSDNTAVVWDTRSGEALRVIRGHLDDIGAVDWHAGGIVTADTLGLARLWDEGGDVTRLRFQAHDVAVDDLAFHPRDSDRFVSAGWDGRAKVFSSSGESLGDLGKSTTVRGPGADGNPGPVEQIVSGGGHENSLVTAVVWLPDGETLATGGFDKTVRLWEAETGKQLRVLHLGGEVSSLAVTPDGKRLVAGAWDDLIYLLDVAGGEEVRTLEGHRENVTDVAVSPDGRRIASGDVKGGVIIWDAETGEILGRPRGGLSEVRALTFSPDGKTLAAAGANGLVAVWDADTREKLARLIGHTAAVADVAFSPDGRRIATVGSRGDGTVRLWDARSYRQTAEFPAGQNMRCVGFSPDGRVLAAGDHSGRMHLWRTPAAQVPAPPDPEGLTEPAAVTPEPPTEGLRVLGWYTADELPMMSKPGERYRFDEPDRVFYLVILSVPISELALSDEQYRQLAEKESAAPPRDCVWRIDPSLFRLVNPEGRAAPATLFGNWPNLEFGFSQRGLENTRSEPAGPSDRYGVVAAWVFDPKDLGPAFRIQFRQGDPLEMPAEPLSVPKSAGSASD